MRNKITAVAASVLTTSFFILFGYNELGTDSLKKAIVYAAVISLPIMLVLWKYKTSLLKVPRYMSAAGIIAGIVIFNLVYKYDKMALLCIAILVGILMVFVSVIYTDNELKQD